MSSTALKVANGFFTIIALLTTLYTLSKWASAILVWGDAYALSQALTWSLVMFVAFIPVFGIEWLQNRGESTSPANKQGESETK